MHMYPLPLYPFIFSLYTLFMHILYSYPLNYTNYTPFTYTPSFVDHLTEPYFISLLEYSLFALFTFISSHQHL